MRYCLLLFFIFPLSVPVFAEDTLPIKHHYIGVDPISACLGTLAGSYEYVLGKHGFYLGAQYTFPLLGTKAYSGTVAYCFHYKPGIIGSFIGPFCKYGKSEASFTDESRTKYSYVLTYTTFGADWGTRGDLWNKYRLYYTLRLGAGYPISTLTWKGETPPGSIGGISLHTFTSIIKIAAIIDGELTLTFAL